jgi:hypothetical protein
LSDIQLYVFDVKERKEEERNRVGRRSKRDAKGHRSQRDKGTVVYRKSSIEL